MKFFNINLSNDPRGRTRIRRSIDRISSAGNFHEIVRSFSLYCREYHLPRPFSLRLLIQIHEVARLDTEKKPRCRNNRKRRESGARGCAVVGESVNAPPNSAVSRLTRAAYEKRDRGRREQQRVTEGEYFEGKIPRVARYARRKIKWKNLYVRFSDRTFPTNQRTAPHRARTRSRRISVSDGHLSSLPEERAGYRVPLSGLCRVNVVCRV